eukprot:Partr_v1_DN23784_c0_g1_i1_m52822 putative Cyclin
MDLSIPFALTDKLSHFLSMAIWDIWQIDSSAEFSQFRTYCRQLLQHTHLGKSSVIYALNVLRKFVARYPRIVRVIGSQYRMVIVSLMMANKFLDDFTYTNKTWSLITGRPLREINCMEIEFLRCLNHCVPLAGDSYSQWCFLYDGFLMEFYGGVNDTGAQSPLISPVMEVVKLESVGAYLQSPPLSPLSDSMRPRSASIW